jgi:ribonuclease G
MSNILVVNSTSGETRVALCENGIISELYIERKRERGIVGNIYKGRLVRVLPGMQASFIDIAQEKAGFLHVSDFYDFEKDLTAIADDDRDALPKGRGKNRNMNIGQLLNEGEEIIVQVSKDPIETKGARMTSHISIPGRYVVFMPTVQHIGISKRIKSDKERKRLRRIVEDARPDGTGFIVRTVSQNVSEAKLRRDMQLLVGMWSDMLEKANKVKAPYMLYEEPDLILRSTRDLVTADIDQLVVDDKKAYDRIMEFINHYMPDFADSVRYYDSDEPIFDAYGIEIEIQRATSRRVDLPSGGYLIFDKTEALTSIDINTGSFVGSTSLEDTIYKTNLEAAEEIVYQLRLRNIGGLIIIDFIDMDNHKNREKVYQALEKALEKDKVTTNALAISEFGLVEMTRKRVRESLVQQLCETCKTCEGDGYYRSVETVAYTVIREVRRDAPTISSSEMHVHANDRVVQLIKQKEIKMIRELENSFDKKIVLHGSGNIHVEDYDITSGN